MRPKPISAARLALLVGFIFSATGRAAQPGLIVSANSSKKEIAEPGKKGKVRSLTFDVRIQSPVTNEVKCMLEWYFIASLDDGFGYFLAGQGTQDITLAPRGVTNVVKTTPIAIKAKATQELAKGEKPAKPVPGKLVDASAETKGYIVRLRVGEDVIATLGEPPFIMRKAGTPEALQELISAIPSLPPKPPQIKVIKQR